MRFALLRRPASRYCRSRSFRPWAELLEDRSVPATITWDGGGGDFNWNTPFNWSTNTLPGPSDDVMIDLGDNNFTVNHWSGTTAVHSLTSLASINLSAGTLSFATASTISGQFTWAGGTLGSPGGGSLTAAGGMQVSNVVTLDGITLHNTTTATLNDHSGIFLSDGAVLDNAAEGTLTVLTNASVYAAAVDSGSLTNEGTITVQTDSAGSSLALPITDTGSITLQNGSLTLGGSTYSLTSTFAGSVHAAAGTTLLFPQLVNFTATSSLSGDNIVFESWGSGYGGFTVAGSYQALSSTTVLHSSGSFTGTVNGVGALYIANQGSADFSPAAGGPVTVTLASLNLQTAILQGSDNFIVSGPFTWSGSTLAGPAGSSLTTQTGFKINAVNTVQGRALINTGTANWTAGTVLFYGTSSFTNIGTLNHQIDGTFGSADNLCQIFNNQGTFIKSGGSGTTHLQMQLYNSGTVRIEQGTLSISCGYVQVFDPSGSGGTITGSFTGDVSIANPGEMNLEPTSTPPAPITNYRQTATGTLVEFLGGPLAGTQYGQIVVNGEVNLDGTLQVTLINDFVPHLGDQVTVIDNRGRNPINGTFMSVQEGELVRLGSLGFSVSYVGGDGNDLVLKVVVVNGPPTADAGGPYTVVRGGTLTLDASGSSDPDQPKTTLTYAWDFDGDSQFDDATGMNPVFSAVGLATGSYTVGLLVTDSAGVSATTTAVIQVVVTALLPDPCDGDATALFVGGTEADDIIVVSPVGSHGEVSVSLNGQSLGTFDPTGRIIVLGLAGADNIQVADSITLPAELRGGPGNDRVKGGSGNDILIGGDGDDLLVGGNGRDLLIGGFGSDRLVGNAEDDILIAGTTAFDDDGELLCLLLAEWTSSRDYATRIANLMGTGSGQSFADRLNGDVYLKTIGSDATIFDDGAADVLTGSAGQDWFLAQLNGDDGAVKDKITDLSASEFANDLDFILA